MSFWDADSPTLVRTACTWPPGFGVPQRAHCRVVADSFGWFFQWHALRFSCGAESLMLKDEQEWGREIEQGKYVRPYWDPALAKGGDAYLGFV